MEETTINFLTGEMSNSSKNFRVWKN